MNALSTATLDSLWLVIASTLVFFMQAGFALVEGGSVRSKNSVNVVLKNFADMCFGAVAYLAVGFAFMFGSNPSGWIGTTGFFLDGIPPDKASFILFQVMFASTAATIVSGAVAERMRFLPYLITSMAITGLTYPVFGAWAWPSLDGTRQGWLAAKGFHDFAGSTVVHSVGAWSSLAALMLLGPRLGRYGQDGKLRRLPGHNMPMVALGGFVLWMGWFGFNGGSTLRITDAIGGICLNTHLGGCLGLVGAILAMSVLGQPLLMCNVVNGALGGLVSVTAGADILTPAFASLTGLIGGFVVIGGQHILDKLRIDDAVGAIAVHGFSGAWGTIAAGLFWNGKMFDLQIVSVQLLGVGVAFVWAFVSSGIAYWLIGFFSDLRASTVVEQRGLDYAEHNEIGYPEFQQHALHEERD